ncbi:hypothetical protein D9757_009539 [Collybiopsis confluens]|uniref:Uncharacterized protein n=1 Tax=Collybiopsis confluens TaxID=2823264 RepID=A0A8H5H8F5_9AGAR|nr:hypothetical protein D9757_009539 [Collybiopsis confluens]
MGSVYDIAADFRSEVGDLKREVEETRWRTQNVNEALPGYQSKPEKCLSSTEPCKPPRSSLV